LRWRERIARGELLGPTLSVGGPLVDGSLLHWMGSAVAATFADAERIVAEHKKTSSVGLDRNGHVLLQRLFLAVLLTPAAKDSGGPS